MSHSLGILPKRKYDDHQARKPSVFHFLQDNDGDSNTSLNERTQQCTVSLHCSTSPPSPPPPHNSPLSPRRPNNAPWLPRGAVAPILLSNGKPLKPSLKSSRSMSMPPPRQNNHQISCSNSESYFPHSSQKTVHFPDKDDGLTTICIYNRSASPDALNNSPDTNDDETETDRDELTLARFSSPAYNSMFKCEIDSTRSSPIPCKFSPHVNLLLESLSLALSSSPNSAAKPFLTGSVLVRNLAFEKQVSIRFTLDDWQTVSEVSAHYADSLCRLPSHIHSLASGSAWNNSALQRGKGWDRFAFIIHLEDYAYSLSNRILWLASCYRVNSTYPEPGSAQCGPGGEWWDNNNGTNYCVEFKSVVAACPSPRGRLRCETVPIPIISNPTQSRPTVMCKEQVLGTIVSSVPNSETQPVHQTERDPMLLCSGIRKLSLCNCVPPVTHLMLSALVPPEGFLPCSPSSPNTDPQSLSSATLRSPCDEDSPSPISSTLSTPSMSPTIASRLIVSEQVEISTCLASERVGEDEFRFSRPGHVADWGWSAPDKSRATELPDQRVNFSSVSVPPTLPGGKSVTDGKSPLDALVKQWCFAQGPSPAYGDGGIMA